MAQVSFFDLCCNITDSTTAGAADSVEEHNRLLETISRKNVAKLRRELIYIYKLPPVTDQDYEHEDLALRRRRKHEGTLGGVWLFDDLDTDDYLTDDTSSTNTTPHRFSNAKRSNSVTSHSHKNVPEAAHPPNHRFDITHPNAKGGGYGIRVDADNKKPPQPLPHHHQVYAATAATSATTASSTQLSPKSRNYDKANDSELSDSHKSTRTAAAESSSGLSLPLPPLPITKEGENNNGRLNEHFSDPTPQQLLPPQPPKVQNQTKWEHNGESWSRRANKWYNTGHFRKSHAIIWDPHPQYRWVREMLSLV